MSDSLAVSLHVLGAETSSGQADSVDLGEALLRTTAELTLELAALSGSDTPTLTVTVQTSPDDTNWRNVSSFTAKTAVGRERLAFGPLDRYIRASWTLTGTTPSATFSVLGKAHVVYAGLDDLLSLALPSDALSGVSDSDRVQALIVASAIADGYLNSFYELPLTAWGEDLKKHTASVGAFHLMAKRVQVLGGPDELLKDLYDAAIRWFERIAAGKLDPPDIVDSTPTVFDGGAVVYTRAERGDW